MSVSGLDNDKPPLNRRSLARELSRCANASVAEVLAAWRPCEWTGTTRRIGITGAPGSGKSSVISHLAGYRAGDAQRLGILAIDPSSPQSGGAILGDRVRMDAVIDNDDIYIRSLASRRANDGLTDNVGGLLEVMERHGFDEVILETVGVGQAEYAVRTQVDTLLLVLTPDSGDAIQAMKCGIMELADLYVINKSDLPGASKIATETRAILGIRSPSPDRWLPQVVEVSSTKPETLQWLSEAIDAHQAWLQTHETGAQSRPARVRHQLSELLGRRLSELADARGEAFFSGALPELFQELSRSLQTPPA